MNISFSCHRFVSLMRQRGRRDACGMRRSVVPWLILLWLFAFFVRAIYLMEIHDAPLWSYLMGDAERYDGWATEIAAGDFWGHEVFYQAPLYPYVLSMVYIAVGKSLAVARVFQAVLGATSCVLVALAGRRLLTPRVGWIAGLMLAVYAPSLFSDGLLQKTSLAMFLFCVFLTLTASISRDPRNLWTWWGLGLTLGALALVRENSLVLIPILGLWSLRGSGRRNEGHVYQLARCGSLAAGTVLVLIPIAVRNYCVGGEWCVTTAQAGPNLYIGNQRHSDGTYHPLRAERGSWEHERKDATEIAELDMKRSLTPLEVSRYWIDRTLDEIRAAPGDWLRLMLQKVFLIINATEIGDTEDQYSYCEYSRLLRVLTRAWHFGVLFPLACFGLCVTWRRYRRLGLLYLITVTYCASVVTFYVFGRYRLPLATICMLFASAGLVWCIGLCKNFRRHYRRFILCGVVTVVVASISNQPSLSINEMRAATRLNLAIHMEEQEAPVNQVRREYRLALQLEPDDASAHTAYAGFLRETGRFDDAMRHFHRALRLEPANAEAHNDLGLVYLDQGDSAKAMTCFQNALDLRPSWETHFNLGVALLDLGRPADAIVHFETSRQYGVSDFATHYHLGRAAAWLGRKEEAITQFREALKLRPDAVETRERLARVLAEQGDAAAAEIHIREALKHVASESARSRHLKSMIRQLDNQQSQSNRRPNPLRIQSRTGKGE